MLKKYSASVPEAQEILSQMATTIAAMRALEALLAAVELKS